MSDGMLTDIMIETSTNFSGTPQLPKLNRFIGLFLGKNGVLAFNTPLQCLALRKRHQDLRSNEYERP